MSFYDPSQPTDSPESTPRRDGPPPYNLPPLPTSQYAETPPPPLPPAINFKIKPSQGLSIRKGNTDKLSALNNYDDDNQESETAQRNSKPINIKPPTAFSENGIIVRPLAINSCKNNVQEPEDDISDRSANNVNLCDSVENKTLQENSTDKHGGCLTEVVVSDPKILANDIKSEKESEESRRRSKSKKESRHKVERRSRKRSKDRSKRNKQTYEEENYRRNQSRESLRRSSSSEGKKRDSVRESSQKRLKSGKKKHHGKDHKKHNDRKSKKESRKRSRSSRSRSERRRDKSEKGKKAKKEKRWKHSTDDSKWRRMKKELSGEISDLKNLLYDDNFAKKEESYKSEKSTKRNKRRDCKSGDNLPDFADKIPKDLDVSDSVKELFEKSDSMGRAKNLSKSEKNKKDRNSVDAQMTLDELEITIVNDRIKHESVSQTKKKHYELDSKGERLGKSDERPRRKGKIEEDKVITENIDNEKALKDSENYTASENNATEKNKAPKELKRSRSQEGKSKEKSSDVSDENGKNLPLDLPKENMDYDLVFMGATVGEEIELRKPARSEEKNPKSKNADTKSSRNSLYFVPKQVKNRQKLDFVVDSGNYLNENQESLGDSPDPSQSVPKVVSKGVEIKVQTTTGTCQAEEIITPEKVVVSESHKNNDRKMTSSVDSDKYVKDFSLSEISESSSERAGEKIRKQSNELNFSPKAINLTYTKDDGVKSTDRLEVKSDVKAEGERRSAKKDSSDKRTAKSTHGEFSQNVSKYEEDAHASKQSGIQKPKKEYSPSLVSKRSKSPTKVSKESNKTDEKAPGDKSTSKSKTDNRRKYRSKTSSDRNKVSTKSTSKDQSNSRSGSYRKESSMKYNPPRERKCNRSRSRSTSYNSYKRPRELSRSRTSEGSPIGKRRKSDASFRNHRDVFSNERNTRESDRYLKNGTESRSASRVQSLRYHDVKANRDDRCHDRYSKRGSYKRQTSLSSSSASSYSSIDSRNLESHRVSARGRSDTCLNICGLENISSQSTAENNDSVKTDKPKNIINEKINSMMEEQSKVSKQHQEDPQWTSVTDFCPIKAVVTPDPNRGERIHSIVSQPPTDVSLNFIPNALPTVVAEELSGSKAVKKMVDEKVQCWSDSKKVSIDQWLERSATVPTFDVSQFAGLQNAAQRLNQPLSSLPDPPTSIIPPNFPGFVSGGPNAPPNSALPFPMPPFIPSFLPPPQFISSLNSSIKPGSTGTFLPAGVPCEKKREESEKNPRMSVEESNKLCAELEKMKNSRTGLSSNKSNQKNDLAPPLPPPCLPIDQSAAFQQLVQSILPIQQPIGVTSSKGLMSTSVIAASTVATSVASKPPPTPPPSEPIKPKTPPPMPSPSYSPSLSPVEKREEKKSQKAIASRKRSHGTASVTKSPDHGNSPAASKVEKAIEPSPTTTANTMQGTLQNLQELLLNIKGATNVTSTVEPNLRVSPAAANKRKSAFDMGEEVMVPLGLELSEFTPPRMGEDDSTPTPSNTEKLKDLEKLFPPTASSLSPVKMLTEVKLSSTTAPNVKISNSVVDQKRHFQDKVAAYAKKHLKPHFVKGKVNKDQYKHIMRRVVNKCTEGVKTYEVKQEKVRKLVENYVSHMQTKTGSKH